MLPHTYARRAVFAALFVLFSAAGLAEDGVVRTLPVQTTDGPIIGETRGNVAIFRGIPYAKPPVGELRWTYTKPQEPWKEPRECLKFSAVCPQPTVPLYGDLGPSSEDCLYLNVWTGAKVTEEGKFADEKRPVLFWIHGGAFTIGAASQSWYEGTKLAQEGAVVVSINYRLGPFGFLAHPKISADTANVGGANFGLHDIQAAFFWAQVNAGRFGGDTDNITIWGESAGAAAVSALLVANFPNRHVFQRAILMSTNTDVPLRYRSRRHVVRDEYGPPRMEDRKDAFQTMEELGIEFQARMGYADSQFPIELMRTKTPAEILKAARPGSPVPGVSTTDNLCVDGSLLGAPIAESFKQGGFNRVPIFIGNVADEGSMFAAKMKLDSVAKYKDFLTQRFGAKADKAFAIYPANSDTEVLPALSLLFSDIFVRSTRMHTRLMAPALERENMNKNIFVYEFTRRARPMLDSGWGVYHGSELPFFFGTVDDKEKYTDEDRELSRLIRTYIINFARNGNPNSPIAAQGPEWPAYTRDEEKHIVLDTPISTGEKLHAKTLDALIELEK